MNTQFRFSTRSPAEAPQAYDEWCAHMTVIWRAAPSGWQRQWLHEHGADSIDRIRPMLPRQDLQPQPAPDRNIETVLILALLAAVWLLGIYVFATWDSLV